MKPIEYVVIWGGRGELLPAREERRDSRYSGMPTYDIDDGDESPATPKRNYNKTGKYVGIFSRANPAAKQYSPRRKRLALHKESR